MPMRAWPTATPCSLRASMGDGYGPCSSPARRELRGRAGRGDRRSRTLTSAYLALRLAIGDFRHAVLPFDENPRARAAGACDVRACSSTKDSSPTPARDWCRCWTWCLVGREDGRPAASLGGNAIRRDLGPVRLRELAGILERASATAWSTANRPYGMP